MKIVFFTDLDNTLLYSYKHDIGRAKRCVEVYEGREISYITQRTDILLKEVLTKMTVVPVTTRTLEQYRRIRLGVGSIPYALTCNGGILLCGGKIEQTWYKESLELVADSAPQLEKAQKLLEEDRYRSFEVRNIQDLFLFTKSSQPQASAKRLAEYLDTSVVDVFCNGMKVYVVPVAMNKGNGLKRLAAQLGAELTIAAGDSEFDIPMLACADYAAAPMEIAAKADKRRLSSARRAVMTQAEGVFSEWMLEYVLRMSRFAAPVDSS